MDGSFVDQILARLGGGSDRVHRFVSAPAYAAGANRVAPDGPSPGAASGSPSPADDRPRSRLPQRRKSFVNATYERLAGGDDAELPAAPAPSQASAQVTPQSSAETASPAEDPSKEARPRDLVGRPPRSPDRVERVYSSDRVLSRAWTSGSESIAEAPDEDDDDDGDAPPSPSPAPAQLVHRSSMRQPANLRIDTAVAAAGPQPERALPRASVSASFSRKQSLPCMEPISIPEGQPIAIQPHGARSESRRRSMSYSAAQAAQPSSPAEARPPSPDRRFGLPSFREFFRGRARSRSRNSSLNFSEADGIGAVRAEFCSSPEPHDGDPVVPEAVQCREQGSVSRTGSSKDLGILPPRPFFSLSRRRSLSSGDVLASRPNGREPSASPGALTDRSSSPSSPGPRHRRTVSVETRDDVPPAANPPQTPRSRRSSQHQRVEVSAIYQVSSKPSLVSTPSGDEHTEGKINQYHILREIGSGAFGRVVLVRDQDTGIYYACKIVSKSRLRKKFRWPEGTPRRSPGRGPGGAAEEARDPMDPIKREIAILKKVSDHPCINQLVEVMDDAREDNLYMVFELCEYGQVMRLNFGGEPVRPFSEELARKYFRDIVLGLEYLHHKKIIHRDLKPENLLRTAEDTVQIADFGISHMFGDDEEDAKLQDKNASPVFMPPEAFSSDTSHISGKALDVWSLGVTLYCFVHGHPPFEDASIISLSEKIEREPAPVRETLSEDLRGLLDAMLAKEPSERIRLPEIRGHPWTTDRGRLPMMSSEDNCRRWEDVTEDEVNGAVKPATSFLARIIDRIRIRRPTSGSLGRNKSPGPPRASTDPVTDAERSGLRQRGSLSPTKRRRSKSESRPREAFIPIPGPFARRADEAPQAEPIAEREEPSTETLAAVATPSDIATAVDTPDESALTLKVFPPSSDRLVSPAPISAGRPHSAAGALGVKIGAPAELRADEGPGSQSTIAERRDGSSSPALGLEGLAPDGRVRPAPAGKAGAGVRLRRVGTC
ncbi:hypothetical protein DFJ74DRAFT_773563 [Hyaloraphidium curvatum]|nr:hypothetical protein DFJ74DRAFT_773563 [Hyaloraphidium curvatum]